MDARVLDDGEAIRVEVGITMNDGQPRYAFDFDIRRNGCVQIRCGVTDPPESMHICDLREFRKAIDAAIAAADTLGVG